jgi:hypothetical protein
MNTDEPPKKRIRMADEFVGMLDALCKTSINFIREVIETSGLPQHNVPEHEGALMDNERDTHYNVIYQSIQSKLRSIWSIVPSGTDIKTLVLNNVEKTLEDAMEESYSLFFANILFIRWLVDYSDAFKAIDYFIRGADCRTMGILLIAYAQPFSSTTDGFAVDDRIIAEHGIALILFILTLNDKYIITKNALFYVIMCMDQKDRVDVWMQIIQGTQRSWSCYVAACLFNSMNMNERSEPVIKILKDLTLTLDRVRFEIDPDTLNTALETVFVCHPEEINQALLAHMLSNLWDFDAGICQLIVDNEQWHSFFVENPIATNSILYAIMFQEKQDAVELLFTNLDITISADSFLQGLRCTSETEADFYMQLMNGRITASRASYIDSQATELLQQLIDNFISAPKFMHKFVDFVMEHAPAIFYGATTDVCIDSVSLGIRVEKMTGDDIVHSIAEIIRLDAPIALKILDDIHALEQAPSEPKSEHHKKLAFYLTRMYPLYEDVIISLIAPINFALESRLIDELENIALENKCRIVCTFIRNRSTIYKTKPKSSMFCDISIKY